jgi:two-component system response regulator HupR/HoxA
MNKEAILVVDDQRQILNTFRRLFQKDYEVITAISGEEALKELRRQTVAVILSDQRMPRMDGVTFLTESLKIQPDAIRLMITGYADIEATIGAVNQAKIHQYISKPFEPDDLKQIVKNAVDRFRLLKQNNELQARLLEANKQLKSEKVELQKQVEKQLDLGNLIGNSPEMLKIFKLVRKVVDTPTTVLISGETGTGKELLAKIIHYNSNRKNKMFVVQNCGAIPDTLLQSELFGHVKGSFTGAVKDKIGLFESADNGTIFLDEIGDTSPALQLGLLRVLQEGEIKPVGSAVTKKVNVRVIAATNRDLQNEVKEKRFREDLYYRLSVFPIVLPSLKERREDIPDLIQFFLSKYTKRIGKKVTGIEAQAIQRLVEAEYPGNIRELENEIERMVTLADDNGALNCELLSPRFKEKIITTELSLPEHSNLKKAVEHLERAMITRTLKMTKGNVLRSAIKLGLSRVGLHKILKRYQISAEQFKERELR